MQNILRKTGSCQIWSNLIFVEEVRGMSIPLSSPFTLLCICKSPLFWNCKICLVFIWNVKSWRNLMGTELLPMATHTNRGKMWWISFALYYWKIEPMKYLRHHFGVQSNSNHAILHSLHSHSENVYVLREIATLAAFMDGSVTRLWDGQQNNRGSIPGKSKIFLSAPVRPDR
jgi:hypothetical protein